MIFFGGRHAPRLLSKGIGNVSVGRGCGCGASRRAVTVMNVLGMKAAAARHATPTNLWTPALELQHINEEEGILFPLLRKIDPSGTKKPIELLMSCHDVYKPLLAKGLQLPTGDEPCSVEAHGKLEDELIERYADQLLAAASHSGAAVAGGFSLREKGRRSYADAAIAGAIAIGGTIAALV